MKTGNDKSKTRSFALALIFMLLFQTAAGIMQTYKAYASVISFAGGTGTSSDPYQIANADQLNAVRYNLDKAFILIADIDLSGGYASGAGWVPIGEPPDYDIDINLDYSPTFRGSMDGNGYIITGLAINRPSNNYVGLFGYVNSASSIKNIILDSVNITGSNSVGSLVGYNSGGTISNCNASGSVNGFGRVGGLVGDNTGTISKSYAAVSTTSINNDAGGLVGFFGDGTISDSYATGSVTGRISIAGLAGYSNGTISNSYATGSVTGNGQTGGLVGYNAGGAITISYYDSVTTHQSDTGKGVSKSTLEMKTQSTFSGWDFVAVWGINSSKNGGYPYLHTPAPMLNAAAAPGSTFGTTKVTATAGQNNHLVIQVSSSSVATPKIGDAAPLGTVTGVTYSYTSGSNISGVDATTYKYVGVYEADSADKVVRFKLITLTSGDIKSQTNAEAVAADKALLVVGYAGTDSASGVTQNVTLPASGANGTTISWSASNAAISSSGAVTRPSYSAGDASVTLTATITKGTAPTSASDTKTFAVTVTKQAQTNAEAVAADKALLAVGYAGTDTASGVTQNVTLSASGSNGTTISWSTNNTAIGSGGTVTRPSYSAGDASVTLTATITKGTAPASASDTKTFAVTVTKQAQTNAEAVAADKALLAVGYAGTDIASGVTQNVTLPASGANGTTISWSASSAAISSSGAVTRPSYSAGDASVTLTATITKGTAPTSASDTKTFAVTVTKQAQTNTEAVAADKALLAVGYAGTDTASGVTQNVTLPASGANGTTISWTASNAAISSSGAVTRPSYSAGDASVTLTATIAKGTASDTATFTVTVTKHAASTNASLSALTVDGESVTGFAANTLAYTVNVPNATTAVTVIGTASDMTAIVSVTGDSSLAVGDNTVTVTVTAQDGASRAYTVNVKRAAAAPKGLVATALDGQVTLSWQGVDGAVTYQVYGGTASGSYGNTPLATVSGATYGYTAIGLTNGTTYYFTVRASNAGGSSYSNEASATPRSGNANLNSLTLSGISLSPSFEPGIFSYTATVANSTSSATVTAAVYDSGSTVRLTVNGTEVTDSQATLNVGSNKILMTITAQDGKSQTYTVTVTRENASVVPDSGGDGGSHSIPVPDSKPNESTDVSIIANGKELEKVATATIVEEAGKTVLTVTVDASQLKSQIDKEGNKTVISIPVTQNTDKVSVLLTGDVVKALENKQVTMEVQTPNGNYKLPAAEVFIDQISRQFGENVKLSDIAVHVDIAKSDEAKVKLIESTADKGSFTIVVPPVDFTVTVTYNGKTVNVDKFSSYVQREIPLPDGADPSKVTTAAILDKDGTVRHVPTRIMVRGGKYYAVVNSLTNSDYSLIWHPMTFADVEGHWAKDAVNDMASRMVVNGVDANRYNPNAAITRAEFAAIIVRALGLADNGTTAAFKDVNSGNWYIGAVAKAQEYGIVSGYEDGTFRPAKTITREEAMVMIARAMKLAGLETSVSSTEAEAAVAPFADRAAIDAWAKQAVAETVKSGLVQGSDAGLLPLSNITRAETAAIVQRMLKKAGLIDGRN